ncbi:MAG: type III pantothenate kinase [Candidatus Latescibacterota bacterium]
MIALFDSGNSRLHFSLWDGETVINPLHIPYPETVDLFAALIRDLLSSIPTPRRIAACSVSPVHREPLFRILHLQMPDYLVIARTASDLGLKVEYDHPEEYGIDRALAAYRAWQLFKKSCVVIDAGTAVTIDAVDIDGTIRGGYIFPGADTMAEALASQTGLPVVSPEFSCREIGKSTRSCIACGIAGGFGGAVEVLYAKASAAVESGERVVITGGGGEKLLQILSFHAEYHPNLVLEGLGLASANLPSYL